MWRGTLERGMVKGGMVKQRCLLLSSRIAIKERDRLKSKGWDETRDDLRLRRKYPESYEY